jgi:AraC-like DNA-binding protein
MLSRNGAKYRRKIFSFMDNEMETGVEMWRKSNTRRCLSTCLKILGNNIANVNLMEYITMCLDSTNKLEQWYVRHNNVYCLHLWATCFNIYTSHLQALLYMWVHKSYARWDPIALTCFKHINYIKCWQTWTFYVKYFKLVNPMGSHRA